MVFNVTDKNGRKNPVPAGFYLCYDVRCNTQQRVYKVKDLSSNKGYLKPCKKCGGCTFWR